MHQRRTQSHDEIQTGDVDDADTAAAHQPTLICQFCDPAYGVQGSRTFTNISLYRLVEHLILYHFAD